MNTQKPRLVKDFDKLDEHIQEQLKLAYPYGFTKHLISYFNKEGKRVSALPFETDEWYYLVRMTVNQAEQIVEDDEDYDKKGNLKDKAREEYEDKYAELDHMTTYLEGDDGEIDEDEDQD